MQIIQFSPAVLWCIAFINLHTCIAQEWYSTVVLYLGTIHKVPVAEWRVHFYFHKLLKNRYCIELLSNLNGHIVFLFKYYTALCVVCAYFFSP